MVCCSKDLLERYRFYVGNIVLQKLKDEGYREEDAYIAVLSSIVYSEDNKDELIEEVYKRSKKFLESNK